MTDDIELRDFLRDEIRAAIAEAMPKPAEPEPEPEPAKLRPHRVKATLTETVTEPGFTYDKARAPRGAQARDGGWSYEDKVTRYVGPHHCPDCGLGLYSTEAGAMACVRLRPGRPGDAKPDHVVKGTGGVIACGVRD